MTFPAVPVTIDWSKASRAWLIGIAAIAIVLGIVALLFPGVTLLTVAILFGIHLVVAGAFRLVAASIAGGPTWMRVLLGVVGVLLVAAGVLCLANPFRSIAVLGIVIGLGWLVDGIGTIVAGATGRHPGPRWAPIVSGAFGAIAGVVMILLPGLGIETLVLFGAWLLIAIGLLTLLTLPTTRAADAAPVASADAVSPPSTSTRAPTA